MEPKSRRSEENIAWFAHTHTSVRGSQTTKQHVKYFLYADIVEIGEASTLPNYENT